MDGAAEGGHRAGKGAGHGGDVSFMQMWIGGMWCGLLWLSYGCGARDEEGVEDG